MGDHLETPGAVDFFRSVLLFSTINVTRKLFDKSTEVYISHNSSITELFLEETPILGSVGAVTHTMIFKKYISVQLKTAQTDNSSTMGTN